MVTLMTGRHLHVVYILLLTPPPPSPFPSPSHPSSPLSAAVQFLFRVLSTYSTSEQRQFVQFVTGSPRLPVGGG